MSDIEIGQRILEARGLMSQETLAAEMRYIGFTSWRQSTVWKLETGDRKLTLAEAHGVSHVLECSLDWLASGFRDQDVHNELRRLEGVVENIRKLIPPIS